MTNNKQENEKMTRKQAMVGFEQVAYRPARAGEWILCCDNHSNFSTKICSSHMKYISAIILKRV